MWTELNCVYIFSLLNTIISKNSSKYSYHSWQCVYFCIISIRNFNCFSFFVCLYLLRELKTWLYYPNFNWDISWDQIVSVVENEQGWVCYIPCRDPGKMGSLPPLVGLETPVRTNVIGGIYWDQTTAWLQRPGQVECGKFSLRSLWKVSKSKEKFGLLILPYQFMPKKKKKKERIKWTGIRCSYKWILLYILIKLRSTEKTILMASLKHFLYFFPIFFFYMGWLVIF